MTGKYLYIITVVFLIFTTSEAQNFTGKYIAFNSSNGIEILLDINQGRSSNVSGKLILNGNDTYLIEGKVDDYDGESILTGSINKGSDISFFEAYIEVSQLVFTWVPVDKNAQPDYYSAIEVIFDREEANNEGYSNQQDRSKQNSSDHNYDRTQKANIQRDSYLVGLWRYTDSYTSGDFSMVTEKYMEVRMDGTYSYGNGKVAGGGNSGSFGSGGGDVITGNWRTENGIIYIDEGGYGNWIPYSGYYIEGNSLMLKFENGSREIWNRVQ